MCGVVDVGFHAQSHGCKADVATSVPSWTSHRRPIAFTALGAQGVAPGGNGARLAQCDLRAQLRVAIRGRLIILRLRNGDEAAGCGLDGAIQGERRRVGPCVKTPITWRCAVRAGFSSALKQG